MSWGAVIVGGAALVGGAMSSRSNSQAAGAAAAASRDASAYQAQVTWDMYNQNRTDMLPYLDAGKNALRETVGGSYSTYVDRYILSNGISIKKKEWNDLKASGINPEDRYGGQIVDEKRNLEVVYDPGIDPTGGAGKYLEQLNQIQYPSDIDPTGGAQSYLDKLNAITFPSNVDPTGGMQKYLTQLENLEFKLDENDPIYKWRASENERQVNQFMASRGKYDSRAAANMLLQSGMQLQADETERQFNQRYLAKYQQLTDLAQSAYQKGQAEYAAATDKYSADISKNLAGFNEALTLGQTQYGAGIDAYNAAVGKATQGYNAALTLGQTEANQLLNILNLGSGNAATLGQFGQGTANQLANISAINSANQQDALLAQGKSNAQMWTALGQLPANMMAANYYMR